MAQGDGSYANPIVVDGLIKKDGKVYKLNTGNTKNCVKSVNNIKPDENGNVAVPELDKTDIENSITEIKKKNAEQDTALSQAKQDLSTSISTNLASAKTYADDKANDALTNAKNYTDTEKAKYLPLIGGEVVNSYYDSTDGSGIFHIVKKNGAELFLFDQDSTIYKGGVYLRAFSDKANRKFKDLKISSDGTFTWDNYSVVRELVWKLSSGVYAIKLNHGLIIQAVRIAGNQGQSFGTVNFPIPFSNTDYFVFAQSQDPDENLAFQIANVSYLNKTTTSCRVAHKVDGDSSFFTGGCIDVLAIGI